MLRTRRVNSDLDCSKTGRTTRHNSFRDGTGTVDSHKISIYEPKMIHSKKSNPSESSKKSNPQDYIIDTLRLLKHYYQKDENQYFTRVQKYLNVEW